MDWRSQLSKTEIFNALEPLFQVPADHLRKAGSAESFFTVRSDRVSRAWGDPLYVALWRTRDNGWWIRDFGALGMEVRVYLNGAPVALRDTPRRPYGYNSDASSLKQFLAKPGDQVRLTVRASSPEKLTDGELVVERIWPGVSIKDRLVGADLDEAQYKISRILGWIGLVFGAAGAVGLLWLHYTRDSSSRPSIPGPV